MRAMFRKLTFLFSTSVIAAPVIVLDAGHEPSRGGATSSCLKKEYVYNDEVVAVLKDALAPAKVVLTRLPNQEVDENEQRAWPKNPTLLARAAIANKARADLFISIHHDSVADEQLYLDKALCGGQGGMRVKTLFKNQRQIGFSVFVYDNNDNENKTRSIQLARLIGKEVKAMGRIASDYHVKPFENCESCRVIDKELGVYHQDLVVLKNTTMPAVLIEVGNLLDPQDEKLINTPQFRKHFAAAVKKSIDAFLAL